MFLRKTLVGVFSFFSEMRASREDRYRDYAAESRKYDLFSNEDLVRSINPDDLIRVGDFIHAYKSISQWKEFRLSDDDYAAYMGALLKELERSIRRGQIDAYLTIEEELIEDARISIRDLLKRANIFELPSGQDSDPMAKEVIAVAIEPEFKNTPFGRLQEKLNRELPLRTPSTDVEYKSVESDHHIDIQRPVILAAGMVAGYIRQNVIVAECHIPTYFNSAEARYSARNGGGRSRRVYRGVEY
jgi:hypothetical protein